MGQVRAEFFTVFKKFCPYWAKPWQNFLGVVKKFCPILCHTKALWPKLLPIFGKARADISV